MNLVQTVEWAVIAPPVIAAFTAVAVLLADLFLPAARKALLGPLAAAGLALAALSLLPLRDGDRSTFCLPDDPALCAYSADRFAVILQLLVLGGAFLTVLLSIPEANGKRVPAGEFWFLLLSSAAGAALLPAARDLATLIIALEVTTLPAYALVGLRRGSGAGPEAALKFFLSSVTATAVALLGIGFVYAASGSLFFDGIAEGLDEADPRLSTLAEAGVALTLIAFAFKMAAVPFHFWVPETYLGAPLPVAGYLSVVGKTAGLAGLILVTTEAFPGHGDLWGPLVAVLAGLTMTAGNVAALRTDPRAPNSAIRLLAWSSIGQAGYLLVPIAAAAYTEEGAGATVAYALMYGAVNLGAFAVAAHVARQRPAHRVDDYRGLWARQPAAALAMGFFLLCLAGLPPGVIGLFAKVAVFETAVDAGLGVLAVVMAVNVAIALYYYLRWTAVLFQPAPHGAAEPDAPRRLPAAPLTAAIGLAAGVGIVLSGAPQLILTFASGTLL
ncbi:NADH-quinone oxidoreductase subunit N [Streptomyces sp. MP131-18]|uniref:NADH-quinone oxidoreductase subunit N n=1 Tax=Streptomyces sp. MP131-18 TaxID=1857892 RepID=UPI00097C43A1|nr:NADH-quinone oxidoreductase subunit N [Streptomyces sp. MP131-18]ONK12179.1 NADH-quinone oxidoreductase subunit N [Streptomyces sp. MP131-18]